MCTNEYSTGKSSVPIERLFLKAGKLISSKRSLLKCGIEDKVLFPNDFLMFFSVSHQVTTALIQVF